MLWVSFLALVFAIINLIFGLLPNIPAMPDTLVSYINQFFDLIFQNSGLVGFFIPIDVVKIALPIALIIVNFKYIYSLLIWIIKKLPQSIE